MQTKKQTAANNELLRQVKTLMNKPIFRKTSAIVNLNGEEAARAYLQQFFITPVDEVFPR